MTRENTKKLNVMFLPSVMCSILQIFSHCKMFPRCTFQYCSAGLIVGWKYGLSRWLFASIRRSVLFANACSVPSATGMAFESGTYGFVIALAQ